jgi:hypothetical protein
VIAPSSFFERKMEVGHSLHQRQEVHALNSSRSPDRRNEPMEKWKPNSALSVGVSRAGGRRDGHGAGCAIGTLPRGRRRDHRARARMAVMAATPARRSLYW